PSTPTVTAPAPVFTLSPYTTRFRTSTDEDTPLSVPAPGVLGNDSDPDSGDTFSVTAYSATSAAGASVVVNADGSYSYDPTTSGSLNALAVGATATDTFTYTITDNNGATSTATVTITVTGVNDAPVAVGDSNSPDYASPLSVPPPGVLSYPTRRASDLTFSVTAYSATSAAGASVVVNADGSYSYDPTTSGSLNALAV